MTDTSWKRQAATVSVQQAKEKELNEKINLTALKATNPFESSRNAVVNASFMQEFGH